MFPSQVGLFRKSGVKSRIQALRQQCELSPDSVSYEDQSAYDVADMVKQFFRDLPEPLLTSKLGETFLHIYQCKSPWSCECCNVSWLKSSACLGGCEEMVYYKDFFPAVESPKTQNFIYYHK